MSEAISTPTQQHLARRWPWRLAVAFVLVTLVLLVAVPLLVQRRVDRIREEIELTEPARTLVMQWQFHFVREMAALNELLLSGDSVQEEVFDSAFTRQAAIQEDLGAMAARLGPAVLEAFTEARTLATQWHERVDEDALFARRGQGAPVQELRRERNLFETVLRSTAAVDAAILQARDALRRRVAVAERAGMVFTLVLGALALVAASAVIAIEARIRRLAAEAERRRAQADAALAEAARVADERTRLLRGITHDVKNPLGAARGYAELLAMEVKAPLAPGQKPLVAGVERSIDSALAIIADLLDYARAEGTAVNLRRVRVNLNELVAQAVEDYRAVAFQAGHEIEAVAPDGAVVAHTDPGRVRQVLDNLVSNAVKYTPAPGRVTIRARTVLDPDAPHSGAWAVVEVADTGPGIPPVHRDAVFDEFTRLHDGTPIPGHGLGLATARRLARQLGGDLTIADADRGATFVLWLPQREKDGGARQDGAPAASSDEAPQDRGTSFQSSPSSSSVTR